LLPLFFVSPLAQSRRHDNIEEREMCNGCNGVSFGNHGVPEGDRIPSLKSHRKALEQESDFPGVFWTVEMHLLTYRRSTKSPACHGRLPHFGAVSHSHAASLKCPAFLVCRLIKF